MKTSRQSDNPTGVFNVYVRAVALICLLFSIITFFRVWKQPYFSRIRDSSNADLTHQILNVRSTSGQLQLKSIPHSERLPDKCWSESESHLYYQADGPKASLYLRERLSGYEKMHKKCVDILSNAPYLDPASSLHSETEGGSEEGNDCRYVVAGLENGVGNQVLSAVSTFLFALLTNRTLLVCKSGVLEHLCNPFPGSGWLADATKLKADM